MDVLHVSKLGFEIYVQEYYLAANLMAFLVIFATICDKTIIKWQLFHILRK